MVNVLQIALCVESPEALAPRQLVAIHSVLAKMYDDPDFGDEAANDLTQELIEGGVDVFREIG
jgi:predicted trehalose synthase